MMRYMRPGMDTNVSAKLSRASLRRAAKLIRPDAALVIAYMALLLTSSLLGAVPPLVLREIIDQALPHRNLAELYDLVGASAALILGNAGLGIASRWLSSKIGENLICRLRGAVFEHVQSLSLLFFARAQTGALISRINDDVLGAQTSVQTVSSALNDIFNLAFTLVFMIALSPLVTAWCLVLVPLVLVLDRRLGGRLAGLSRRRMNVNATMSAIAAERFNVSGALIVKLFGRPAEEANDFKAKAESVRDAGIRMAVAGRIYFAALALVAGGGTVAVYLVGGQEAISGSLAIGSLVALAQYASRLYQPLTDLASARVNMLTAMVSFDRVFEVLDTEPLVKEADDAVDLIDPRGRLEFNSVSFRYPDPSVYSLASLERSDSESRERGSGWVLSNCSFVVEPGRMVALVGPSGAGKTTLASMVSRLIDPTTGSVAIDGYDLTRLTLQSLRDMVGVVPQDPHLFHDTIAANLRYARPGASDSELEEACRAARIDKLVASLPDGYDTVVGDRGYRLSGGEKQRLAIARVFLKRPRLVVLDEATSHLDTENEAMIQEALAEILRSATSLVIAHRLSTVASADEILVMDGGRIRQRGTHSQLIEADGLYRDLYRAQATPANTGP
jgi:ATP-binding cassette subfamily B protein